jgi:hypothetical protein
MSLLKQTGQQNTLLSVSGLNIGITIKMVICNRCQTERSVFTRSVNRFTDPVFNVVNARSNIMPLVHQGQAVPFPG